VVIQLLQKQQMLIILGQNVGYGAGHNSNSSGGNGYVVIKY